MPLADNTEALLAGSQLGNTWAAQRERNRSNRAAEDIHKQDRQDRLKEAFGDDTVFDAQGNVDILGSAAKRRARADIESTSASTGALAAWNTSPGGTAPIAPVPAPAFTTPMEAGDPGFSRTPPPAPESMVIPPPPTTPAYIPPASNPEPEFGTDARMFDAGPGPGPRVIPPPPPRYVAPPAAVAAPVQPAVIPVRQPPPAPIGPYQGGYGSGRAPMLPSADQFPAGVPAAAPPAVGAPSREFPPGVAGDSHAMAAFVATLPLATKERLAELREKELEFQRQQLLIIRNAEQKIREQKEAREQAKYEQQLAANQIGPGAGPVKAGGVWFRPGSTIPLSDKGQAAADKWAKQAAGGGEEAPHPTPAALLGAIKLQQGIRDNPQSSELDKKRASAELDVLLSQYSAAMGSSVVPVVTTNAVPGKLWGTNTVVSTNFAPAAVTQPAATNAPPAAKTKASIANRLAAENPKWSRDKVIQEAEKEFSGGK